LGRVRDWRGHYLVAVDRYAVAGRRVPAGNEQFRPLVNNGEAGVAVIEEHVRRLGVTDVLDLVADGEAAFADLGLDPPAQDELLAEHSRLADLTLGPQHTLVAVPALAVASQARRQAPDPAVQAVPDRRADVRLAEVLGGVLARSKRVIQAARGGHGAAPGSEPAPSLWLVIPGPTDPGVGLPVQRHPAELTSADVETAVHDDVEREARTGAELEQPDASLLAVAKGDEPHPGDLVEP